MPGAAPKDWSDFERDVAFALRLLPDAEVKQHVLLGGKDVDVVFEQRDAFRPPSRLAVECKYYARPLTREQVTAIWSHYSTLVQARHVDGVLLVTSAGIVANAKEAMDGIAFYHATYRELCDKAFSAEALVRAAQQAFTDNHLSEYYQRARGQRVDIAYVAAHYDAYYSEVVDYCRADTTRESWLAEVKAGVDPLQRRLNEYRRLSGSFSQGSHDDLETIGRCVAQRLDDTTADLDSMIDEWLDMSEPFGVALLGSYGMGKSSYARYLVHRQATAFQAGTSSRMPLLIELRHFGSHQDIAGLVSSELANRLHVANASFSTFMELNRAGRLLVVLDGFDEMKEGMSRDALAYNFGELNSLLEGKAKVVLCGRPSLFESASEQRRYLSSGDPLTVHQTGRYVQIAMAPMKNENVVTAMNQYAQAFSQEVGPNIADRLDEVEQELAGSAELHELLSRPVHFPMLLKVLPRWDRPLRDISRANLYDAFIRQTIQREMAKSPRPETFTTEKRLEFAADLAVLMYKLGESRSVKFSMIPDELVAPHRRGGESLDAVRRELVRACFLETKPPDVLYFPHKSFAEFLVAERVLRDMDAQDPDTDATIGDALTQEVLSFIAERATRAQWANVLMRPARNTALLRNCCHVVATGGSDPSSSMREFVAALTSDGALAELSATIIRALPEMVVYRLAIALEELVRREVALGEGAARALDRIGRIGPDIAAVHAYRALSVAAPELSREFDASVIGLTRAKSWRERGWSLELRLEGTALASADDSGGRGRRREQLLGLVDVRRTVSAQEAAQLTGSSTGYMARLGRELVAAGELVKTPSGFRRPATATSPDPPG